MSKILVKVESLQVGYNGKSVLDCPALHISERDFIGITGPNGGGKTTLIKALLKSIPYQGKILYSKSLESEKNHRRIGYLPQVHEIDRSFPIEVFEVVLSGLQAEKGFFKRYTRQDREQAEGLLEFTGIKSLKNRIIGELSGGEFQRVMLCRALISDPLLLILDEPDNFLDSSFEQDLYRILAQLNKRMAIVMVSHDSGAIERHAQTVLYVDRGVTVQNP